MTFVFTRFHLVLDKISQKFNTKSLARFIVRSFPIFSWMFSYKKDDFVNDLISGCTVAIMHIPQGMGYALLANLQPIIGIYIAIFPVIPYVIFGTSRHNSMGIHNCLLKLLFKIKKRSDKRALKRKQPELISWALLHLR